MKLTVLSRILLTVIGAACTCLPASAHDYWLDPGDFSPEAGSQATIRLCSGHSFPKKSADTHGYSVHKTVVNTPGGTRIPLTVEDGNDGKWAKFTFATNGMHMVCMSMTAPKQKEPSFWTRALIVVGNSAGTEGYIQTGKEMEIVPGAELSGLAVGDSLPLSVAYNGRKIRALVTITQEDGRVSHIRSSPRRPAMLRTRKPGKYLVVASVAGKKCSLTFAVEDAQTGNDEPGRK